MLLRLLLSKKIGDSNGKRGTVVHSPLFLTALIYVGCVLGCLSHFLEFSLSLFSGHNCESGIRIEAPDSFDYYDILESVLIFFFLFIC